MVYLAKNLLYKDSYGIFVLQENVVIGSQWSQGQFNICGLDTITCWKRADGITESVCSRQKQLGTWNNFIFSFLFFPFPQQPLQHCTQCTTKTGFLKCHEVKRISCYWGHGSLGDSTMRIALVDIWHFLTIPSKGRGVEQYHIVNSVMVLQR